MTRSHIRNTVGIIFILSHFFIVIMIVGLYLLRGFTFDEITTTIAIIGPVLTSYTVLITRHSLASSRPDSRVSVSQPKETLLFTFVALFFPNIFVVSIAAIVICRAYNVGLTTFEQFKILLGVLEALFATYVGLVITELFDPSSWRARKREAP